MRRDRTRSQLEYDGCSASQVRLIRRHVCCGSQESNDFQYRIRRQFDVWAESFVSQARPDRVQHELHPASVEHSHTTHVLSTATIHYPYHPHYGQTVTMVRKCSHFGPRHVQVALPSGGQLLVPEWMLDEDLCRGMEIVEYPTLSITALL